MNLRLLRIVVLALGLALFGACSATDTFGDAASSQRATGRTRADARLGGTRTRAEPAGLPEGYTMSCSLTTTCPAEVKAEFGPYRKSGGRCALNSSVVDGTVGKTYTCEIAPETWLVYV